MHRANPQALSLVRSIAGVLVGFLSCTVVLAAEPLVVNYDQLVAALSARESRFRSIDLTWTAVNDYSAQYVREMGGKADPFGNGLPPANPPTAPRLINWTGRLVVSGENVRSEHNMPLWNFQSGGFEQLNQRFTWDGKLFQELRTNPPASIFPFQGHIADLKVMQLHLLGITCRRPLWWIVRPLDKANYWGRSIITPDASLQAEQYEGREYLAIRKSDIDQRGVTRDFLMLLNPAQDFALRAFVVKRNGVVEQSLLIDSVQDATGLWVPKTWRDELFSLGALRQTQNGTVTKCKVNDELAADLFHISFPEWTIVTDKMRGPADVNYLVLPGGVERVLTHKECYPKKGEQKRKEDFLPRGETL